MPVLPKAVFEFYGLIYWPYDTGSITVIPVCHFTFNV